MSHALRNRGRQPPSPSVRWIPNDTKRKLLALEDDKVPQKYAHITKECDMCASSHVCIVSLSCGHSWCKSCAKENIRVGMGDAESWPPRCREPFSEQTISWAWGEQWLQLWRQMGEEQGTPGGQRVYCSRSGCPESIPDRPDRWLMANGGRIEEADQCLACGDKTCRKCRCPAHPGEECHLTREDEELMDLMDRERMPGCPECNRVIQLKAGCNRLTCYCGHQWCFLCGTEWGSKGCRKGCELYNGKFLSARARKKRYRQGRSEKDHIPIRRMQFAQEINPNLFGPEVLLRFPRLRMVLDMLSLALREETINRFMMRPADVDVGRQPRVRAGRAQEPEPSPTCRRC